MWYFLVFLCINTDQLRGSTGKHTIFLPCKLTTAILYVNQLNFIHGFLLEGGNLPLGSNSINKILDINNILGIMI